VHDDWLVYGPKVDRWTRPFRGRPRLAALAERATDLPARVEIELAAQFVFVSETVRRRARQEGYVLADSTIAHSGVDPLFLDPRPLAPWRWRLLYAGRLDERKGVDDALASLTQLPDAATLTVVGGGDSSEIERLRSRAGALGVGARLRLLGMRSREQLRDEYEAADAVLFPVRWREPWGLVPLEAMGLGRPVIATADGGPGEYLRDGENAVIVPPLDPAAIAQAVRRLAADSSLREQLRTGGLETAARHTELAFNEAVLAALLRASSGATANN
jgi:glycosyltransferase involved in cell wall biosynthesis